MLRGLVDEARDGLLALDERGTIVAANLAAAALVGRDRAELVGTLLEDNFEERAPLHKAIDRASVYGETLELGQCTLRLRVLPGVEPRTLVATLSQPSLRERVTREFLRNAAHQLRTPLAGITAAIETLQAGAKERPADRDRFLEHLETHAIRLTRIARSLLVLARTQSGDQLRVDRVELKPLLDEIASSLEPPAGVRIVTECKPGVHALASPELLLETLVSIAENAIAHTERGTVELGAELAGPRVAIHVSDSGSGIPREFHDRIFEPFFRVNDDGKGYGLGLAIAAQAVAAMEGEIEVSDRPRGGTTFTVTLRSATVLR